MRKDSLVVNEKPGGTVVTVRAGAGGHTNAVTGLRHGALLVSILQAAEKDKSNTAVVSVLAKFIDCGKHQVELICGITSADKQFLLVNQTSSELLAQVKASLNE